MRIPELGEFEADVAGTVGEWPRRPDLWSYSSLRRVERCPLQWMLANATYRGLWDGWGYPPLVDVAPFIGTVVHRSVELIVKAFHTAQCGSVADPAAVEVLRSLGGYSSIVDSTIGSELETLRSNPRMIPRIEALETAVRLRAPEMRSRVQLMVSRLDLASEADSPPHGPDASVSAGRAGKLDVPRRALGRGSHPEVELVAREIRLRGIADLVTVTDTGCSIMDYKTGAADDGHVEQIRDYALLWALDRERNPDDLPVEALTVSYVSHERIVEPPSLQERRALTAELKSRVTAADAAVQQRPPEARPDPDVCSFCPVRHMCEVYWRESVDAVTLPDGGFGDAELTIQARHSSRGWRATSTRTGREILLRVPSEGVELRPNSTIRVLRVMTYTDADSEVPVVTMTRGSEIYPLRGSTSG